MTRSWVDITGQTHTGEKREWKRIEDFPRYSVNQLGEIYSDYVGDFIPARLNQQGIPYVGLVIDRVQHSRSVPLLVAQAFLGDPPREGWDTPIQLDGDRLNCRADNLMWRPRWFAIKYHRQFKRDWPWVKASVEDVETGDIYDRPYDAVVRLGLMETEIMRSITNPRDVCFPGGKKFRFADIDPLSESRLLPDPS